MSGSRPAQGGAPAAPAATALSMGTVIAEATARRAPGPGPTGFAARGGPFDFAAGGARAIVETSK